MIVLASIALVGVLVLGTFARRAPIGIDANVASAAFGKATSLAWTFTKLGYARDLLLLYAVAGLALRIERPRDVAPLAFLALAQVLSQLVSTYLKTVFKRERPERWLKRHETSAGYPSGHATTATVTYGGIAIAMLAPLDPSISESIRLSIGALAAFAAVGILWSRLALGAHYLSDVLGGMILGTGTLAIVLTVAFNMPRTY